MVTRNQKYSNRFPKKENIIDLTDSAKNNKTPVVRTLDVNPVTGARTYTDTDSAIGDSTFDNDDNDNSIPIIITGEDKGENPEPYTPPEIEPQEEERLEAEGATIIDSTTYYPASKMSISKRSQTPQERADEMGYSLER